MLLQGQAAIQWDQRLNRIAYQYTYFILLYASRRESEVLMALNYVESRHRGLLSVVLMRPVDIRGFDVSVVLSVVLMQSKPIAS